MANADQFQSEEPSEHRARHIMLHQHLDELVADFIRHTERLPSKTTVFDLIEWSHQQTLHPTEEEQGNG